MGRTTLERIGQLREGTVGAAAALPEEHADTGREAVEAADRLLALARRAADEGDPSNLEEALDALERVHFDLLRMEVHGAAPEEAGVAADLERLRGRVADLEARGS